MDSDNTAIRKRRFYQKKAFWIVCASVIVAICARYAWVKLNDKPLTILPVDSADAQPDYAYGTGIDFRQRYNLRQDASVLPADENGWKLILQALGPLALREEYKAKTIPWDRFPTDDSSKQWFHEKWTPLCEKFGIDPTVPPTFLTRLDLQNYLVKNGITGEEEDSFDLDDSGESDEESSGFITSDWLHNYKPRKTYWENYEEKTGRVDSGQALDCCLKLWEKPWTRDDYPVAARWIEENADLYDVYSKAVRMPRFACWHFISDKQADCWFDLSLAPDVQFLREIARSFFTRANYRIGMADYSGAIDDVESILLLAQSVFENSENCCLTYALIGAAIMGFAAGTQLDGGASEIRPTQEEFARLADVWNVYFGKLDFEEATRNALKGERDVLFLPLNQDYLSMLRNGSLREVFEEISFLDFSLTQDDSERPDSFLMSGNVFLRGLFDDGAYMAELEKLYNELVIEEKTGIEDWSSIKPKSREAKLAKQLFLCLGAPAGALRVSLERVACFVNMQRITIALLSYQTEHGALPPAFTVDEEGNPLHSWRVLILPYLGEDSKALYDQI
ncbi:MAG: DUF1559 domain-containing protein [Thermoguttaceae bacterium]|nr:DUF1559 domain-containing protein [Thermoguttaceae bacterium]